uniref:Uncharacterized protein n=1 Tax=Romanomermis culicivorax TaxID=13658 RepID=A0A915I7D4_ROMCU
MPARTTMITARMICVCKGLFNGGLFSFCVYNGKEKFGLTTVNKNQCFAYACTIFAVLGFSEQWACFFAVSSLSRYWACPRECRLRI